MLNFVSLNQSHFPLLLKWLESPHVKAWWDQNTSWTPELIQEKYGDYVKGYKRENGVLKRIDAFIISFKDQPIGYIQSYNAYDFQRSKPLVDLPKDLGAFDMLIGEEQYLNRSLGSKALTLFLDTKSSYSYTFADPDRNNAAAIRAYEKAGFKKIEKQPDDTAWW